jgi:formylglycine-generating enzyme required for sulfatase activity
MGLTIKRIALMVSNLFLALIFIQCVTVSDETAQKPSSPTQHEVKPVKTWKDSKSNIEFVWVPGSCYEMGCGSWTKDCVKDELPVHEVCIDGFWLGKYEVTQGQWRPLMRSNYSKFTWGDSHPVENVSWNDAQKFIKVLNDQQDGKRRFRLPTEAEWEYAARSGGKPEMFSGGNDVNTVAWFRANSRYATHPVGKKAPNGLGIYDMSGNVWEWCQDLEGVKSYTRHTKNNPVILDKASKHRIVRGGHYDGFSRQVRCSQRSGSMPGRRHFSVGFRVAMDQM